MRLKEWAKDARQKQKDREEQHKEQRLNLCGEFLEHALKTNPTPAITPLIRYFKLPPLFPVHLSFACGHLACLIILTMPAAPPRIRRTTCSTIHKICTAFNANRPLSHLSNILSRPLCLRFIFHLLAGIWPAIFLTTPSTPLRIRRTTWSTIHKI